MTGADALSLAVESAEWKLPSRRKAALLALILTETTLFSIFVSAYVYYLGKSLTGPYPRDVLRLPIIATICLLSSSLTIVLAERAFARDRFAGFRICWLITIVLGLIFISSTAREWHELITKHGLTVSTNLFGTTYYSLVGLHASHVIVGLTLLLTVMLISLRGYLNRRYAEHLQMISWYWHFVDAVWVVVFTLVYVIGR
jgi:cytochrome c oxidase subunit III